MLSSQTLSRMTGGGGPGGQIFNIGKSKAALFDAENKVKMSSAAMSVYLRPAMSDSFAQIIWRP